MKPEPNLDQIVARAEWFKEYCDTLRGRSIIAPSRSGHAYRCPCCGFRTLEQRGGFEICPVCFWEDDGQDGHDAEVVRGGPNGSLNLVQARLNFKEFGACERPMVGNVRAARSSER